jgi:hypothetical protein
VVKMRKSILLLFCIAIFIGAGTTGVMAQDRATATVTADIIKIATATERTPLDFGVESLGPQGGSVALSPRGDVATMGAVILESNSPSPASFYITGVKEQAFSITLSSGPTVLSHGEGPGSITVYGWESVPSSSEGALRLEGGALAVNVGATLDVNNTQNLPKGTYAGTYSITFDYN